MKHELPSFALLIDADNVAQDSISPILEEITRHARVTVRRIYGDFTSQNLAGWKSKLAQHAIQPIQQYRNTVGKNASDSALIIDAMDLLHSRRFEGFCLVSSDSDFTRLATRIREDGLTVYGFGEKKAPKTFVNACDRYIYVENLVEAGNGEAGKGLGDPEEPGPPSAAKAASEVPIVASVLAAAPKAEPPPAPSFKPPALAATLLERAYRNVADDEGWAMLGRLSAYIHDNHPDFDPRTYGCAKFIDLIQRSQLFDLDNRAYKNGHTYFCMIRGRRPSQQSGGNGESTASETYRKALAESVREAAAADGWAPIGVVGQKLKARGRTVKESGRATLTDALKDTGLFEMKGNAAARYFRLKAGA